MYVGFYHLSNVLGTQSHFIPALFYATNGSVKCCAALSLSSPPNVHSVETWLSLHHKKRASLSQSAGLERDGVLHSQTVMTRLPTCNGTVLQALLIVLSTLRISVHAGRFTCRI